MFHKLMLATLVLIAITYAFIEIVESYELGGVLADDAVVSNNGASPGGLHLLVFTHNSPLRSLWTRSGYGNALPLTAAARVLRRLVHPNTLIFRPFARPLRRGGGA